VECLCGSVKVVAKPRVLLLVFAVDLRFGAKTSVHFGGRPKCTCKRIAAHERKRERRHGRSGCVKVNLDERGFAAKLFFDQMMMKEVSEEGDAWPCDVCVCAIDRQAVSHNPTEYKVVFDEDEPKPIRTRREREREREER
jgi:hypothetical protein